MRRFASLRGRREFVLVMRRGSVVSSQALTIFAFTPQKTSSGRPKVGIVVTKKVGKAVVRNLLRRRCKAILDDASFGTMPRWYVVQCRPKAAALSFAELRSQLKYVLTRSGR